MPPQDINPLYNTTSGTSATIGAFTTYQGSQFLTLEEIERAISGAGNRLRRSDNNQNTMTKKQRHLNQNERHNYHDPAPDWQESSRGEEFRHSTTLQILDILEKFKIKPL